MNIRYMNQIRTKQLYDKLFFMYLRIYLQLPLMKIGYITLPTRQLFLFSYIQWQSNNIMNSDNAKYFMFIQWVENNTVLICIKLWPFIPYALSHMSNKFFRKTYKNWILLKRDFHISRFISTWDYFKCLWWK